MSNAVNLVVNDGESTPVAHTFAPTKSTGDYVLYEDRLSGIFAGFGKFSVMMKRPTGRDVPREQRGRNIQIRMLLEFPQLEIISGSTAAGYTPAPGVAYRPTAEVIWKLPEQCPMQVRKNLRSMLNGLLTHSQVIAVVDSYDMPS